MSDHDNNNLEHRNSGPNFALEASATLITFIFIPAFVMLVLWFPLQRIVGTEAAVAVGLRLQAVCLFALRETVANALKRKFGGNRK